MEKWSLEYLHSGYGDFLTCTGSKTGKNEAHFTPWVLFSENKNQGLINMRQIFPSEIVFDCEEMQVAEQTIKELQKVKVGYTYWKTGSRGYHIHSFFPQLTTLDEDVRSEIKLSFMQKCGSDTKMKEARRLIAAENRPHFKTGEKKTLIEEYLDPEHNTIPLELINSVFKVMKEKKSNVPFQNTVILSDSELKSGERFFLHCVTLAKEMILPEGARHNVFLKNLAIGFVVFGREEEAPFMLGDICAKQNMSEIDWKGWFESAKQGKYRTFNAAELEIWLRDNDLPSYQPEIKNMQKWSFADGVIYEAENRYWSFSIANKQYSYLTNFVFRIVSKSISAGKIYFEVEIHMTKGYVIPTRLSLEEITGIAKFRKWLYGTGEGIKIYGNEVRKRNTAGILLEFFRETLDEKREELPIIQLQGDLLQVIQDGLRKHKIGIEKIDIGQHLQPDLIIGKRIKDCVALYPTPLMKYFNLCGMKISDTRDLLDILKRNFSVSFCTLRTEQRILHAWKVPAKFFLELVPVQTEDEVETEGEETPTTMMDEGRQAFERTIKFMDGEEKPTADEAQRLYAILDSENYFSDEQHPDIRQYLLNNGAVPF